MKRAKRILESLQNIEVSSESNRLNEKVEITAEQAKDLKDVFTKAGYAVEITTSTNGSVYINGVWDCRGRYVGLCFDQGGFLLSIGNQSHQVITQAEAIKFQKELKTFTDLLEKIKAVNPELL